MSYEERRQARIERMRELAKKNRKESDSLYTQSRKMAECIPFGQPILVGHHSEKRDRNFRNKIIAKTDASIEAQHKAEYYEQKAQAAENNHSISSDDPDAPAKLEEKIAKLETMQTKMREFNKALRKNDINRMIELGFSEARIAQLKIPDSLGRTGFPDYALTNNNGNIRRLKQRLEHLKKHAADITKEEMIGEVKIVDNVADNRLQIFFPDKPSADIIAKLKQGGFRWSHYNSCWQSYRNTRSRYEARNIVEAHNFINSVERAKGFVAELNKQD